eukprot:scpid8912/ scgid0653/ Uromodulin; Tamm-Horsfall urinary glycoprotein; Uromodulin, secreted form
MLPLLSLLLLVVVLRVEQVKGQSREAFLPELESLRQEHTLAVGSNVTLDAPLRNTPYPLPRVIWAYQAPGTNFTRVAQYVLDEEAGSVSYSIGRVAVNNSGKYAAYIFNSVGGTVASFQLNVTYFCPSTNTTDLKGHISWPSTVSGSTAAVECPVKDETGFAIADASRHCEAPTQPAGPGVTDAVWSSADTSPCPFTSPTTHRLQQLAQKPLSGASPNILVERTENVATLTQESAVLSSADVELTATILAEVVTVSADNQNLTPGERRNITSSIGRSVSTVIDALESRLTNDQEVMVSADMFIATLESLSMLVRVDAGQTFRLPTPNVDVSIVCPDSLDQDLALRTVKTNLSNNSNSSGELLALVGPRAEAIDVSRSEVSFDLPSAALRLASQSLMAGNMSTGVCPFTQVQFTVYRLSSLFSDSSNLDPDVFVASAIVSASVGDRVNGSLPNNTQARFALAVNTTVDDITRASYTCKVWNSSHRLWSSEGCRLANDSIPGRVLCSCDRLGSFAVLTSVGEPLFRKDVLRTFDIPLNETVQFRSTLVHLARPAPEIAWYYNGATVPISCVSATELNCSMSPDKLTLTIHTALVSNEGQYKLRASNRLGNDSLIFSLNVFHEDECPFVGCHANASCQHHVTPYPMCVCMSGYHGDGIAQCTDVDECSSGGHDCHGDASCSNLPGAYACPCRAGYRGDGRRDCSDIDECVEMTSSCDHASRATCTNTAGLYQCDCVPGAVGDGVNCQFPASLQPLSMRSRSYFLGTRAREVCQYDGHPVPNVTWCKVSSDNDTLCVDVLSLGNANTGGDQDECIPPNVVLDSVQSRLTLQIDDIAMCHAGRYRCVAENPANNQPVSIDVDLIITDVYSFQVSANFAINPQMLDVYIEDEDQLKADVKSTLADALEPISSIFDESVETSLLRDSELMATVGVELSSQDVHNEIGQDDNIIGGMNAFFLRQVALREGRHSLQIQPLSVSLLSYDFCPVENTTDLKGFIRWPETMRGVNASVDCPVRDEAGLDIASAIRACNGIARASRFERPLWGSPNTMDCPFLSPTTRQLQRLSQENITDASAEVLIAVTEDVENLTRDGPSLSSVDVQFTAAILAELVSVSAKSQDLQFDQRREITASIVGTVSSMVDVPEDQLAISQQTSNSPSMIIEVIDSLSTVVSAEEGMPLQISTTNVDLGIVCPANLEGQSVRQVESDVNGSSDTDGAGRLLFGPQEEAIDVSRADASFDVPGEALRIASNFLMQDNRTSGTCPRAQAQFAIYRIPSLFMDSTLELSVSVGSAIVSATVGDLSRITLGDGDPARFALLVNTTVEDDVEISYMCSFWNTTHRIWSSEGCMLVNDSIPDHIVCSCNHLTNFAILTVSQNVPGSLSLFSILQ